MRRLATALLTSTLVLAGAAVAPAQADDRVREVRVGPAGDDSTASPLPVRSTVVDKLRDARGTGYLHRYADLRKVAYRTPSRREGGTMTVRATWRDLVETGQGRGVRQGLTTFVDARTKDRDTGFSFLTSGRPPRFAVYLITDDSEGPVRVRPDELDLRQRTGSRGTTTATMSTEWLDAGKVSVFSLADAVGSRSGLDNAYDDTRARRLRVGPAPAAR